MGTTQSGFWYPDPNTPNNLQAMFSAAATASEVAAKVTAIRDAVPKAASAAALTALFTAQVDPATGAFMAPVPGSVGVIGEVPVVWLDTNVRQSAGWYPQSDCPYTERYGTPTAVIPATAWTAVGSLFSISETNTNDGTVFTSATDGFTVNTSGQYRLDGFIVWAPGANLGVRYISVSTSAANAGAPGSGGMYTALPVPFTGITKAQSFSRELRMTAGQKASVYAYTTIAEAVNYVTLRIRKLS